MRLDQEVERTLAVARTSFPSKEFPEPSIKMDLTGKCAGRFHPKDNRIRFNLDLMLKNKEDFINETVAHEVAHFVVEVIQPGSKPHGVTWKAIMKLFGIINPKIYHDYKLPIKKKSNTYLYQCGCRNHYFSKTKHKRAEDGVIYTCTDCKDRCRCVEEE
ncbi:MAG: SprT-like domain-containing protein [Proteobacteria bacterium]|nr:SprT-like domain-containing protein [Pseudomonadota bacterium]